MKYLFRDKELGYIMRAVIIALLLVGAAINRHQLHIVMLIAAAATIVWQMIDLYIISLRFSKTCYSPDSSQEKYQFIKGLY
jgi:hypothetical protein